MQQQLVNDPPAAAGRGLNAAPSVPFVDGIPAGAPDAATPPLTEEVCVEFVDSFTELESRAAVWQELADAAAEPNAFLEPWMLLPALRAFPPAVPLRFAFVYRRSSRQDTAPLLCGFFPLVEDRLSPRVPVRTFRLWTHDYQFLNTPLVRAGSESLVIGGLMQAVAQSDSRPGLLELPGIHAEGPFSEALVQSLNDQLPGTFCVSQHSRAFLQVSDDWEEYVRRGMSNHNLRELRRLRRRLAEQGTVDVRQFTGGAHGDYWIDMFLDLESRGWKGEANTAIQRDEVHAEFFRCIVHAAAERGRLMMMGLFLNNEPIAMKCDFLAGGGSFAFKIAYDESQRKFSPGVQLSVEAIRLNYERGDIRWIDSCAVPEHFMINRLWRERRSLQHLLVSTGRWTGDLVIGAWPALRLLNRRLRTRPAR